MRNLNGRIKNVEKSLNLNEKPKTVTIVQFGGELPPDRIEGNTTIHFVKYDEIRKNNEKQPKATI